jgi:hypothetical protein
LTKRPSRPTLMSPTAFGSRADPRRNGLGDSWTQSLLFCLWQIGVSNGSGRGNHVRSCSRNTVSQSCIGRFRSVVVGRAAKNLRNEMFLNHRQRVLIICFCKHNRYRNHRSFCSRYFTGGL